MDNCQAGDKISIRTGDASAPTGGAQIFNFVLYIEKTASPSLVAAPSYLPTYQAGKVLTTDGTNLSWGQTVDIDYNGNVGIGTSNPISKLQVNGDISGKPADWTRSPYGFFAGWHLFVSSCLGIGGSPVGLGGVWLRSQTHVRSSA